VFRVLSGLTLCATLSISVPMAAQVRDPYTAPSAAPAGQPQKLTIAQGALQGTIADGVGWFLGAPYAPPPLGFGTSCVLNATGGS
jgi:hypothetical protein